MKKNNFPTKEEFYKKLLKLRIEKEIKKEGGIFRIFERAENEEEV